MNAVHGLGTLLVTGLLLSALPAPMAGQSIHSAPGTAHQVAFEPLPVRIVDFPQMLPFKARYEERVTTGSDAPKKVMSLQDFDALPPDTPVTIGVWTVGMPSELIVHPAPDQVASGEMTWIQVNRGRESTQEEVERLGHLGAVQGASAMDAQITLKVDTKERIREVSALPFVIAIAIYGTRDAPIMWGEGHLDQRPQ